MRITRRSFINSAGARRKRSRSARHLCVVIVASQGMAGSAPACRRRRVDARYTGPFGQDRRPGVFGRLRKRSTSGVIVTPRIRLSGWAQACLRLGAATSVRLGSRSPQTWYKDRAHQDDDAAQDLGGRRNRPQHQGKNDRHAGRSGACRARRRWPAGPCSRKRYRNQSRPGPPPRTGRNEVT